MNETSSREREDKLRLEIVGLRLKLEESERRQEDMSDCVGKVLNYSFDTLPIYHAKNLTY